MILAQACEALFVDLHLYPETNITRIWIRQCTERSRELQSEHFSNKSTKKLKIVCLELVKISEKTVCLFVFCAICNTERGLRMRFSYVPFDKML